MSIDLQTSHATNLFMEKLRHRYPAVDAVLFGSRARGDFHAESDADIAVVLPGVLASRSAAAGVMADMAFDVLLETGVLISAQGNPSRGYPSVTETVMTCLRTQLEIAGQHYRNKNLADAKVLA
jgi:hypothetical protein